MFVLYSTSCVGREVAKWVLVHKGDIAPREGERNCHVAEGEPLIWSGNPTLVIISPPTPFTTPCASLPPFIPTYQTPTLQIRYGLNTLRYI